MPHAGRRLVSRMSRAAEADASVSQVSHVKLLFGAILSQVSQGGICFWRHFKPGEPGWTLLLGLFLGVFTTEVGK